MRLVESRAATAPGGWDVLVAVGTSAAAVKKSHIFFHLSAKQNKTILSALAATMHQESTLRSQARSEMVFQSFVPEISNFAETQGSDPASLWDRAAMFLSPRKEEASTRTEITCRVFLKSIDRSTSIALTEQELQDSEHTVQRGREWNFDGIVEETRTRPILHQNGGSPFQARNRVLSDFNFTSILWSFSLMLKCVYRLE